MEIKIGIQHVGREIVIDVRKSAAEVTKQINEAIAQGNVLELDDRKGHKIVVPTQNIGYVEIGSDEARPVGFGAL